MEVKKIFSLMSPKPYDCSLSPQPHTVLPVFGVSAYYRGGGDRTGLNERLPCLGFVAELKIILEPASKFQLIKFVFATLNFGNISSSQPQLLQGLAV